MGRRSSVGMLKTIHLAVDWHHNESPLGGRSRQTEIQNLDDTFRGDLDVGGLQVPIARVTTSCRVAVYRHRPGSLGLLP